MSNLVEKLLDIFAIFEKFDTSKKEDPNHLTREQNVILSQSDLYRYPRFINCVKLLAGHRIRDETN